jgi:GNAT superfamily N-acetyltransferase
VINIHAITAEQMPAHIAEVCTGLCWPDSEMQRLFNRIAEGELSDSERHWMIAYAWLAPGDDDQIVVAGWASVTEWRVGDTVRMQVQTFVAGPYRRKGIATAMLVCLTHDMPTDTSPVAVFSDEVMRIARRLGWKAEQYKSVDDGWIGVATTEGRCCGRGSDEE